MDMINRELFEKTEKICGAYFTGGISDELVIKYQNLLGVTFPKSYIEFLKEFGEGGICGTYISGIKNENYASVLEDTIHFRNTEKIPENYIVVQHCSTLQEDWLICLDTGRMVDGESPAVKYVIGTGAVSAYKSNFSEVFDAMVEKEYLEAIGE